MFLSRLNSDIRWTTDLGTRFLAQQADVMSAVQRMRQRAQMNGKLQSTPQENVTTQTQDGQTAFKSSLPILMWFTCPRTIHIGCGVRLSGGLILRFGIRALMSDSGLARHLHWRIFRRLGRLGWGGWGWGPNWFGGTIIVNNSFFHRFGFRDFHGAVCAERRCGPTIRSIGSACLMPIVRWRTAMGARETVRGAAAERNFAARGNFGGGAQQGFRQAPEAAGLRHSVSAARFRATQFGNAHSAFGGIQ